MWSLRTAACPDLPSEDVLRPGTVLRARAVLRAGDLLPVDVPAEVPSLQSVSCTNLPTEDLRSGDLLS